MWRTHCKALLQVDRLIMRKFIRELVQALILDVHTDILPNA